MELKELMENSFCETQGNCVLTVVGGTQGYLEPNQFVVGRDYWPERTLKFQASTDIYDPLE